MINVYVLLLLTFMAGLACAQVPGSTNDNVCEHVDTIFMSLRQVAESQGLYVTAVPNEGYFTLVDNLCVTAFPVSGSLGLYTFYSSVVLSNNLAITTLLLAREVSRGTFRRADPSGTISQRFFSHLKNFTLACTQFEFGVNPSPPLFAVSFTPQRNSKREIGIMEDRFRSRGFQNVSLYALPMNLPTQCVLEHPSHVTQPSECTDIHRFFMNC